MFLRSLLLAVALLSPSAWSFDPEVAPVVSTFRFRHGKNAFPDPVSLLSFQIGPAPTPTYQEHFLWIVRPQIWRNGLPETAAMMWDYHYQVGEWKGIHPGTEPLRPEEEIHYFKENRKLAEEVLEAIFQFRTKQALKDYHVDKFESLPAAIQTELLTIKDGTRAFAVVTQAEQLSPEAIELTVGVSYDRPGLLPSEQRHRGRSVSADGKTFYGYPGLQYGPKLFTDHEFAEVGATAAPIHLGEATHRPAVPGIENVPGFEGFTGPAQRTYLSGTRAELTTFVKNETTSLDLVPLIHQALISFGLTRFGLTEIRQSQVPHEWISLLQQPWFLDHIAFHTHLEHRYHLAHNHVPLYSLMEYALAPMASGFFRIDELVVEAISYPGRRNALAEMYRKMMGFESHVKIPKDPDFLESETELLRMSAHDFEFQMHERMKRRPGAEILETGMIIPFHMPLPNKAGKQDGRGFFPYQPPPDRFQALGALQDIFADPRRRPAIARAEAVDLNSPECRELLEAVPVGARHPRSMLDIWNNVPKF